MSLPKRPERSSPIPNEPFESPEVTTIRGPYWDMPLGSGLESDNQGSVQTSGSTPSEPSAYLYGSNGFVGLGSGLQLGPDGSIEQGNGYIYCTPQYGNLPVTYPPYECNTEVNTKGVTDFTEAWYNCQEITEFPCVDTSLGDDFTSSWSYCRYMTTFPSLNLSSGSIFNNTWSGCYGLTSFPNVDLSNGIDFSGAWYYCDSLGEFPRLNFSRGEVFYFTWSGLCSITSFPLIDTSKGVDFSGAWYDNPLLESFPELDVSKGVYFRDTWLYCTTLTSFPPLDFSSGVNFEQSWSNCHQLIDFPASVFDTCLAVNFSSAWQNCALSQQSVDNILVSLDTAGQSNGIVNIDGGTSSAPGTAGLAAKLSLEGKGWTVLTN